MMRLMGPWWKVALSKTQIVANHHDIAAVDEEESRGSNGQISNEIC